MRKRKFFILTTCIMLLFMFLFSGCGGGGGSDFGNGNDDNGEEIPPENTPSAMSYVEYALSNISIGYHNGDNSEYVTQNLILPTSVDEFENITITWSSSNPSTISPEGNVVRQNSNTNVTLTATASDESESAKRDFELLVIRQRSRSIEQAKSEIQVNGLDEIRLMNVSNDDFQIIYSASHDRVTDIDGKYADFIVSNADDALDSIYSIHGILGLNDPYEELENAVITSDPYGAEYTFAQFYNGIRVYGRNITSSANADGETDFVASSILPTATLDAANLNFTFSREQAENAAKNFSSGNFNVRSEITAQVIFSLENYENVPVPTYAVNIYGKNNDGEYFD